MILYSLFIDGLQYHDATAGQKKAKVLWTNPQDLIAKVQHIHEKHPRWHMRIKTIEIDPVTKKVIEIR